MYICILLYVFKAEEFGSTWQVCSPLSGAQYSEVPQRVSRFVILLSAKTMLFVSFSSQVMFDCVHWFVLIKYCIEYKGNIFSSSK